MKSLMTPVHKPLPMEILQADIRKVCGSFDLEPVRQSGIVNGNITTRCIGSFDTAIVALDASSLVRNSRSIRQDPGEYFFLLLQDAGSAVSSRAARSQTLLAATCTLSIRLHPRHSFIGARARTRSLHIPREEITHRFGTVCTGGCRSCEAIRYGLQCMRSSPKCCW